LAIPSERLQELREGQKLQVFPLLREHLEEPCDIGSDPRKLKNEFPWCSFESLEPLWYLNEQQKQIINHSTPNEHQTYWPILASHLETEDQLLERVEKTKKHISTNIEQHHTILLFGHANFFHRFTGTKLFDPDTNEYDYFGQWLANGEIYELEWPRTE